MGEGGPEAGGGEEPLGLTEGGAEGAREDTEGGDVLLELEDPDREGLCSDVEGGEVLFEFGRPVSETGDLGSKVGSQRGAGTA
jgi:hypothetical protein